MMLTNHNSDWRK